MKNFRTLILNRKTVEQLVDIKKAIAVVEESFREYCFGLAKTPAKIYLDLPEYNGDFRAMPAYIGKLKACTLKWVNVHSDNKKIGLPSVMGLIVLSDPTNGFPPKDCGNDSCAGGA